MSIKNLPQLGDRIFLTDGGIETDLIFNDGQELPHFASIVLLGSEAGREALTRYYRKFLDIAVEAGTGFILESPTWRASSDWAGPLGYSPGELPPANEQAIGLVNELKVAYAWHEAPIVTSGCVGPRGDGYVADTRMTADEARRYHGDQIACFARAGADMAGAITMTYPEEALGVADAAADHGLPAAISFTTETDGRLPSGHSLAEAIAFVDEQARVAPAYYMINCAHPDHFSEALASGAETARDGGWIARIRGIRANASRLSHAELDEAEVLDIGDPNEFGTLYERLRTQFPGITVLGGCCGTDHRHLGCVARACGLARAAA